MNSGISLFKLCAAVAFVVICFFLVLDRSNINKTAEVTGMDDIIEQTKKDLNRAADAFSLEDRKYVTDVGKVFKREHSGYTLYISCRHRGPLYGFMALGKDKGNLPREDRFRFDTVVPPQCRQTSTSSYNRTYHRGHLFAANHFDNDETEMAESFFMSNIVPQHQASNLGAWKLTETITECYREYHQVYLAAGVIYGSDSSDDTFLSTHGVVTPTAMWKFILLDDAQYSAWIIPNDDSATQSKLASFEVPIDYLMRVTEIKIVNNAAQLTRVKLPVFENCHIT